MASASRMLAKTARIAFTNLTFGSLMSEPRCTQHPAHQLGHGDSHRSNRMGCPVLTIRCTSSCTVLELRQANLRLRRALIAVGTHSALRGMATLELARSQPDLLQQRGAAGGVIRHGMPYGWAAGEKHLVALRICKRLGGLAKRGRPTDRGLSHPSHLLHQPRSRFAHSLSCIANFA